MYTKKNARVTFRSNRRSNFKRHNNYSGNKPRNKGNVVQQYNKYLKLAKEFSSSGDRVQSEYYYQFTDHYYRLMLELEITLEENEIAIDNKSSSDANHENQLSNENNNYNISQSEFEKIISSLQQTKSLFDPLIKSNWLVESMIKNKFYDPFQMRMEYKID